MGTSFRRQLQGVLWKNLLLKRAHIGASIFEVVIPVLFMGLLVWIKTICNQYDSPSVAFYCGQTDGFDYYVTDLYADPRLQSNPLAQCLQPPEGCSAPNYYTNGLPSFTIPNVNLTVPPLYTGYGYTASSTGYPWYGITVSDRSRVYDQLNNLLVLAEKSMNVTTPIAAAFTNPSLPLQDMVRAYSKSSAVLAVAPRSSSHDDALTAAAAEAFYDHLLAETDRPTAVRWFPSEADLSSYVQSKSYEDEGGVKVAAAIVFNHVDAATAQWDYSVRVNFTQNFEMDQPGVGCLYPDSGCRHIYTLPPTRFAIDPWSQPPTSNYLYGYTYTGFATLQKYVDDYILGQASPGFTSKVSLGLFPEKAFHSDNFLQVIAAFLALVFVIAYLYPVSRFIRALVLEKETKIKETMKIMGLSSLAYNLSWFITMVVQLALTALLMTLLSARTVFAYSSPVWIWLFLMSFSVAVIMFCFVVSTFFSKSKTAATLGTVLFFAAFFVYYAVTGPSTSTTAKTFACLLAPTCLGLGSDVIAAFEGGLIGLHSDNLWQEPGQTGFTYVLAVAMFWVDALLYALLAAYLEAVLPSDYGTQLPPYFFLLPSYWTGRRPPTPQQDDKLVPSPRSQGSDEELLAALEAPLVLEQDTDGQNPALEPVDAELRRQEDEGRALVVRSLRKVFKTTGADRVAVEGLDLQLYEGQISVLLGHNGAGKSTTISMLTGMIPPTSGDARVRGLSLSSDMSAIRQSMGVCPQHDTLFPELTVSQHLHLFGLLKGVPSHLLRAEVDRMIAEVGLREKAHVSSQQLSGGMKRKLCLAMALIGDSKVVFLDEPTSGMDPYSRRSTWTVLERNKKGRIILLTTHFMDEADILGDRIAIMADGRLKCCGSSLFLKSHYGVGYTMVVVKRDQTRPSGPITALIKQAVPGAELTMEAGAELSFRLPFESSSALPSLLSRLEELKAAARDDQDEDGVTAISAYGISVTTLEEVFMRVGEGRDEPGGLDRQTSLPITLPGHPTTSTGGGGGSSASKSDATSSARAVDEKQQQKAKTPPTSSSASSAPPLSAVCDLSAPPASDTQVFFRHLRALLAKRFIYAKRDKKSQCFQLVVPACLILFGLVLIKVLGNPLVQPDLVLSPSGFNTRYSAAQRNFVPMLVVNDSSAPSSFAHEVMAQFTGSAPGGGQGGVYGTAVPITGPSTDQFGHCARGAPALHDMSNFLIDPGTDRSTMAGSSVYGAVTLAAGSTPQSLAYNILVNATAIHGVGIYMNLVSSAALKALKGPQASITVHNYPLPLTYNEQRASASIAGNTASTFILIAFCFIPASYAIFVVKEAESKAKHQQIISGVSLLAYWLANYLWDLVSYLAPLAITLALLYAFGIKSYTTGQAAGATVAVLLAYAPAVASFTYVWSFLFKTHSAAQNVILFKNFLTGLVLAITSFVLSLIDSTRATNLKLKYLFRLFPAFCLGESLLNLAICVDDMCPRFTPSGISVTDLLTPWAWDVTLADITFLLVEAVVYFLLALAIEYGGTLPWLAALLQLPGHYVDSLRAKWRRWRRRRDGGDGGYQRAREGGGSSHSDSEEDDDEEEEEMDDDVLSEEQRVMSGRAGGDAVRLERLRKVYRLPGGRSKVAVRGLSFGIPKGETLGFLGINGAGKTTTLSILSGEFPPTSGRAFIAGHDIATEQNKLRRKIGYCPQFSALLDALTVSEHLVLFARIKGVAEAAIPSLVASKLEEMDLKDFADKAAASLSGGNQRKLSVAIATMGEPPVLFLDEPSTGMDPVSRRHMWDVISGIRARQNAIILTTHSMEEAEALCTRIAIMVNGRLMCIGTPQHLKSKWGEGFELEVKLQGPSVDELLALASRLRLTPQSTMPRSEVSRMCQVLGRPEWEAEVSDRGSGAVLASILQTDGQLPVRSFCEWWVSQQRFEALQGFLLDSFGGGGSEGAGLPRLLERSSWFSYRYNLPASGLSLARMFEKLEAGKARAAISEYSLGQTTMEAIFNRFASLQHNPEVKAQAASANSRPTASARPQPGAGGGIN